MHAQQDPSSGQLKVKKNDLTEMELGDRIERKKKDDGRLSLSVDG